MNKPMPQPSINPYYIISAGVLAVSFAAIFIKLAEAPSTVIAFYRMAFAFVVLLPLSLPGIKAYRHFTAPLFSLTALAGFFLALHFFTWIASFQFTNVVSSTIIVTTQPIFVVLFSYLLWREHISLKQGFSIVLAMGGGLIIGLVNRQLGGQFALKGDMLALAGAMFSALYVICGKQVLKRISILPYVTVAYGFSALTLAILVRLTGASFIGYGAKTWLMFLGLAVVCTVIGHSSLNWALRYVPAPVVSMCALGEPIGAGFWAMIFFSEALVGGQLLGSTLLLGGIYLFIKQE